MLFIIQFLICALMYEIKQQIQFSAEMNKVLFTLSCYPQNLFGSVRYQTVNNNKKKNILSASLVSWPKAH